MNKYVAAAAVIGAAYLVYKASQGAQAVKEIITEDLNPTSDKNVVYKGVNAVGASVTGDQGFTLGGWLFCKFNPKSTLCNPKRAALNQVYDTSNLSDAQVDLLWEQEKDFLTVQ